MERKKSYFLIYCFVGILIVCLSFAFKFNNSDLETKAETIEEGSSIVLDGSVMDFDDGTIKNSSAENGGAIYVGADSILNMSGGIIENCNANKGGAVYVANGGTFNFTGGEIKDCTAEYGYAIYVEAGGRLDISDNQDGFVNCGESEGLNIYIEQGAEVIGWYEINIYVDNELKKTMSASPTYTIQEIDMPLSYEECCGYFLNPELTDVPVNDTITQDNYLSTFMTKSAKASGRIVNLYTRTASDESNFTFTKDETNNIYTVKRGSSDISGEIVIPREYNGLSVQLYEGETLDGVFGGSITSVILPSNLTRITNYAFDGCGYLINVTIPNSVKSIGESAFSHCSDLSDIIIPDSVTRIESNAFAFCYELRSIYIPSSVTTILTTFSYDGSSDYSCSPFYGTSGTLIYCGVDSKPSGWSTFWNNHGYSDKLNVTWGKTREEYIGDGFIVDETGSLRDYVGFETEIVIPDNVNAIFPSAFINCYKLTSITIPDSVTTINAKAFRNCTGLKTIYIPSSVTDINRGDYYWSTPFHACSSELVIYCGASERPSGWDFNWSNYGSWDTFENLTELTVKWGYTREAYEAEIAGISTTTVTADVIDNTAELCQYSEIDIKNTELECILNREEELYLEEWQRIA